MKVIGNAGDTFRNGTGWTDGGSQAVFILYTQGTAVLLIDMAVTVSL